jgi:hypothetical protein
VRQTPDAPSFRILVGALLLLIPCRDLTAKRTVLLLVSEKLNWERGVNLGRAPAPSIPPGLPFLQNICLRLQLLRADFPGRERRNFFFLRDRNTLGLQPDLLTLVHMAWSIPKFLVRTWAV